MLLACAAVLVATTSARPVAVPQNGAAMTRFVGVLDERIAAKSSPTDVAALDAKIRAEYEKPLAVMITDMSGMTDLTKRRGIIGILTLIREMQRVSAPVLERHRATWIKTDADDLFVVHESPVEMLALARDLQKAIAAYAKETGEPLEMAIGLSYGPVLLIGDEDIWGDPVNVASKLGEDTARGGEILVSSELYTVLVKDGAGKGCTQVTDGKLWFAYYRCR